MANYLVEEYDPGGAVQLEATVERLHAVAAEMPRDGVPVRYARAILVPADETCFDLVKAPSPDAGRGADPQRAAPLDPHRRGRPMPSALAARSITGCRTSGHGVHRASTGLVLPTGRGPRSSSESFQVTLTEFGRGGRTVTHAGQRVIPGASGCERRMPSYLVESYATGGVVESHRERARLAAKLGTGVRYVRTAFLPGDETILHLFEATSAEALSRAARNTALQYDRIVEPIEAEGRSMTARFTRSPEEGES
jgi:hypothetical protein